MKIVTLQKVIGADNKEMVENEIHGLTNQTKEDLDVTEGIDERAVVDEDPDGNSKGDNVIGSRLSGSSGEFTWSGF